MKKIFALVIFSASVYSMQKPLEVEVELKASFNSLSQMEMGMPRQTNEPRSDLQACCDCTMNPDLYISVAAQTSLLIWLVETTFDSCGHKQTAFLPMIYASAMSLNAASIAHTAWKTFRESKFKAE